MAIPVLTTERLILRGLAAGDAPAIQKNFADYEVIRYLGRRVPWPYPEDGARQFAESVLPAQGKDRWIWVLLLKTAPEEAAGVIDLRRGETGNRGFWLARRLWGQGLMTEATNAVTEFAFTVLGFERLIFKNATGNTRSRRIKEKTGATFLGVEPGSFADPDLEAQEVWEMRREDWMAGR